MDIEEIPKVPDLALADLIFTIRTSKSESARAAATKDLETAIKSDNLAPLYQYVCKDGLLKLDESELEKMQKVNADEIKELRAAIEVAEEAEDEIQIVETWVNLGNYQAKICAREDAEATLRKALELTASSGARIDILLTITRLGFFFRDRKFVGEQIEALKAMVEKEGDWERKNRYKTYRGLHLLSVRQFKEAAELLIDSFATFTCTELLTYHQVVEFGIAAGAFALDRVDLKKSIVDSPEILSIPVQEEPKLAALTEMTNALYTCEYRTFFEALARVETEVLVPYWALAPHASFYVREMRCKAYAQLLESYMALNIKSMADSFGVSVEFLDKDLGQLIPHKKLNCVVDKVNGVVVTNRPDSKNAQYQQLIKQGDALLTKLQKYSAAIRLYGSDQV